MAGDERRAEIEPRFTPAVEAMRAAVKIVGDGEEPVPYDIRGMAAEVVRLRAEVERLSSPSRDGTAAEIVRRLRYSDGIAPDAAVREIADWIESQYLAARSPQGEDHETARPEQPPPDALGGQPPAEPETP
jgi:hypothetical protein